MEAAPSAIWDALIIPAGEGATSVLSQSGHALEFLKDQYRHCKPILLIGDSRALLNAAGVPLELASGGNDPGLLLFEENQIDAALDSFVSALTQHRHFERETDPPRV